MQVAFWITCLCAFLGLLLVFSYNELSRERSASGGIGKSKVSVPKWPSDPFAIATLVLLGLLAVHNAVLMYTGFASSSSSRFIDLLAKAMHLDYKAAFYSPYQSVDSEDVFDQN